MKVIVKPTVNTLMLKYNKKCKSLVIVTSHGQTLFCFISTCTRVFTYSLLSFVNLRLPITCHHGL